MLKLQVLLCVNIKNNGQNRAVFSVSCFFAVWGRKSLKLVFRNCFARKFNVRFWL